MGTQKPGALAQNVYRRRKSLGYSQGELADKAGVFRLTVTNVERGRDCTFDTARRLAQALDCTLDDLIREPV